MSSMKWCSLVSPAEEILKVASKKKVDLIVTGAKGMGAVARFCLVASRRRWFSRVTARCWWSAEAGWSRAYPLGKTSCCGISPRFCSR